MPLLACCGISSMSERWARVEAWWRIPPGIHRGYVDCRFGQLHYALKGPEHRTTALPLVCFHASPISWRNYSETLIELGRDRLVVAVDSPGHGDSSKPPQPPAIEDYAAAVGEGLDRLGISRCDVLGNHTGSKVAVELALQRPALVRRLVLISAPVYSDDELQAMKTKYDEVKLREDGAHLAERWRGLMTSVGRSLDPWLVQRYFVESQRGGLEYKWGHHAAFAYQHAQHLPHVGQPVLVLNPRDEIVAATRRAGPLLRNGGLREIEEDYQLCHDKVDALGRYIRAFLDGPAKDVSPDSGRAKAPPLPPRWERPPVRRSYAHTTFGQVHVRAAVPERAAGRPVLCLHASPRSGQDFDGLLPVLGSDRVVLAPDMPGLGGSTTPATAPGIEDYATAMLELLDRRGITSIDLLGYHTGALTAVAIALRRPGLVHRVALISAPVIDAAKRHQLRAAAGPEEPTADGAHLVARWRHKWPWRGPGQTIAMVDATVAEFFRAGPFAWWAYCALYDYPFADRLAVVEHDILVLNPRDEISENTRRAASLLRRGGILDLPDLGYGMMDAFPTRIAGYLREHYDR
ncbi:MAG: alpha/beta fold hydrolase [Alphaproteobacteria bacterium]|nr:alpha/beta fold hydrolase [Alphaproteobacteria bacterium]